VIRPENIFLIFRKNPSKNHQVDQPPERSPCEYLIWRKVAPQGFFEEFDASGKRAAPLAGFVAL
jgi:hypothetical protein